MSTNIPKSVVFLDRDGVINRNRGDYVKSCDEFEFLPGVMDALRKLNQLSFRVIVITNQSAINRGVASREVVEGINRKMVDEVAANGGEIEAVYYCPHRPDEGCKCRKPRPGLLFRARDELNLELSDAVFVGDQMTDMEAARAAGLRAAILVSGSLEPEDLGQVSKKSSCDFHVANDLAHVVNMLETIELTRRGTPSVRGQGAQ